MKDLLGATYDDLRRECSERLVEKVCELLTGLKGARWATQNSDWRSWNFSRARARRTLERSLPDPDCGESVIRSQLPALD